MQNSGPRFKAWPRTTLKFNSNALQHLMANILSTKWKLQHVVVWLREGATDRRSCGHGFNPPGLGHVGGYIECNWTHQSLIGYTVQ